MGRGLLLPYPSPALPRRTLESQSDHFSQGPPRGAPRGPPRSPRGPPTTSKSTFGPHVGAKMAPKWILNGSLAPFWCPECANMAPKWSQNRSKSCRKAKRKKRPPNCGEKKSIWSDFAPVQLQKTLKNIGNLYVFCKIAFSDMKPTLGVQRCQRPSPNAAKIDQDGANINQNGPL